MIHDGHDGRPASAPPTDWAAPGAPNQMIAWAESFLANAPVPLMMVESTDHRVMYANPAFRRLHFVPITPKEVPVGELFDGSAAGQIETLVDRVVAMPAKAHETVITTRTGEPALQCAAWLLGQAESLRGPVVVIELRPATDTEAMLAFQVDMTGRLLLSALREQISAEAAGAAERVAVLAIAARDRFLTTMSHELRTPLNAIGGYVQLIDMGLRGPVTAEQHHDLGRIQHAQQHLLGLINSVLNFAKLDSGSVQYAMEAVRVDEALFLVQEMLMPHLRRQGLSYENAISESQTAEPLFVHADPEKLRQILINLLTNAIKFTAPGGTISVACEANDETISIDIADTGRGIPPDQLSTVFDPFVQIGRKLDSNDQGVGLGLSISRELALGMGGQLSAVSAVGVGSTFTLTLNRASTGAPPSP